MSCTTFIFFSATHDFLVQYHSSYLSSQSSAFCDPHSEALSDLLCTSPCPPFWWAGFLLFADTPACHYLQLRACSLRTDCTAHSPAPLDTHLDASLPESSLLVTNESIPRDAHSLWYMLHKSFVLNKVFTLSDLLPIVPASESKTLY